MVINENNWGIIATTRNINYFNRPLVNSNNFIALSTVNSISFFDVLLNFLGFIVELWLICMRKLDLLNCLTIFKVKPFP